MENSYGIGVTNRYELFYNEEIDQFEAPKKEKTNRSSEKENKKTTKSAVSSKKSLNNDDFSKQSDSNDANKSRSKGKNFDTRVKFSDREERNNRRNRGDGESKDNKENSTVQRGEGGDSRGRGMPGRGGFNRGGRGGRRGSNRGGAGGKREYDRQSGMVNSSVKPFDKRDGSGSFNWGSDKDQINQEQANHNTELDTSGDAEKVEETVNGEESAKEDEGPKEMTLDEYRALQKREKPVFKTRKAGEGENTQQWKKTYVLNKGKQEEASASSDEEEERVEEHKERSHGNKNVVIPIDFCFSDSPMRGRGRGRGRGGPGRGRGMGRGRGGRFQGGPHRQEAPKMDDERAFPSLG